MCKDWILLVLGDGFLRGFLLDSLAGGLRSGSVDKAWIL